MTYSILKRWFITTGTLLLSLVLVYILLHCFLPKGFEYKRLSKQELADVQQLLMQSDSIVVKKIEKDSPIYIYLHNRYPQTGNDSLVLHKALDGLTGTQCLDALRDLPIRIHSYFWLGDYWIYLEVLFWSMFGLLASLFYHGSEAARDGTFSKKELPVHIAKLFYGPICALVMYFGLDLLSSNGSVTVHDHSSEVLIFSFIMGFFSGRMMELLNKLKELLLPGIKQESADDENGTEQISSDDTIKKEYIENRIKWKAQYTPNVSGIGLELKSTGGKRTGQYCVQFEVTKKDPDIADGAGKIPPVIRYTKSDGTKICIPTDVYEAPPSRACNYVKGQPLLIQKPPGTELGCSISEQGTGATGTIGLKLVGKNERAGKTYILGAYHVFCAMELALGHLSVSLPTAQDSSMALIAPSEEDAGTTIIAKVVHGQIDAQSDFALAELQDAKNVSDTIAALGITARATRLVDRNDLQVTLVQMAGRSSNKQVGQIIGHEMNHPVIYNNGHIQEFTRMIKTTALATEGDSGAAVLDMQGKIIGLVISTTREFSYILPVDEYLQSQNVDFIFS